MSDTAKPPCICGNQGVFKVTVEVAELELRHGRWDASYPAVRSIVSIMCVDCVKANVSISTKASANLVTEN